MIGVLSGDEIEKAGIIKGAFTDGFRGADYDLHIQEIIRPDGKVCESYTLPPQGIVEVVSRERICLPPDIVGYALVKTGLCNEAILALSIGIVDPGYEGKLSSALINFGRHDKLLASGEVFLRLTFHRIQVPNKIPKPNVQDDVTYLLDKRKKVV